MTRAELEHVLRACADITKEHSFVAIGSQAVLLGHPNAPDELLASRELDLYPATAPAKAELIEGVLRHRMIEPGLLVERARSLEPSRCDPAGVQAWLQRRIDEAAN